MRCLITLCLLWISSLSPASAGSVEVLRHFPHDGLNREYYLHLPHAPTGQPPLLVVLHGMGGNAANLRYGLGLNERADQHGFAVLYPQGLRLPSGSRYWEAGFDLSPADDLGFLADLITQVTQDQNLDARRVFVLGISNGAFMAYHLACHGQIKLVGIASVIGSMSGSDWENCRPAAPLDLLHVHGADDPLIRFDGHSPWQRSGTTLPSVQDVVKYWAMRVYPDTPALATQMITLAGIETPERLRIDAFRNAQSNRRAVLIAIKDFGHDWPFSDTAGLSTADTVAAFFMSARPSSGDADQPRSARASLSN